MPNTFDPSSLPPAERKHYRYEGPEVIYTFWAKHGPCMKPGCGHRTPIFRSPVVATKRLGVKYLECTCKNKAGGCGIAFHAELGDARIAPDAAQTILANEHPYSVVSQPFAQALMAYERDGKSVLDARIKFLSERLDAEPGLKCPACGTFAGQYVRDILARHSAAKKYSEIKKKDFRILPGGQGKKPVYCTLLIDPEWLKGSAGEVASAGEGAASASAGVASAGAASASARPSSALSGSAAYTGEAGSYQGELGGYIDAPIEATAAWYRARLANLRLIEVRGQVASGVYVANGFPTPTRGFAGPVGGRDRSPVASSGSAVASSGRVVASSGSPVPPSGSSGGSSDSSGRSSNSSGGSRGGAPGGNGGAPEARSASPETSGVRPGASGTSPEASEEDSEAGEEAAGLPPTITLRDGRVIETGRGTGGRNSAGKPIKASFACGRCGLSADVLKSVVAMNARETVGQPQLANDCASCRAIAANHHPAPVACYMLQCYDPQRDAEGHPYGGRYFKIPDSDDVERMIAAEHEWMQRRLADLAGCWPISELPHVWKTHGWAIPEYGYTHWYKMFNARQLMTHALVLRQIADSPAPSPEVRHQALGAAQQYLRNHNMFCIWHTKKDHPAPFLSNSYIHPRHLINERNFMGPMGYGNWVSCRKGVMEGIEYCTEPFESIAATGLEGNLRKSTGDRVMPGAEVRNHSSSELPADWMETIDLAITDPPFGENITYADLSDFFYVWIRLVLKQDYPEQFAAPFVPQTLEAISNPFRNPGMVEEGPDEGLMTQADAFYLRMMTSCWAETARALKPAGILAFTFHHDKDDTWALVLRSLFDAGLYLEATYPVASDESKGENAAFGSQKIEYDIIHVCRKRLEEPKPVSWPKMRQWVKAELARLRPLLESYKSRGLQDADVRVILRGKALEFYSRHYGKVLVSAPGGEDGLGADISLSIRDALLGINMLLDESGSQPGDAARPPSIVQPMVYQFLRLFGVRASYSRDEVSKLLRGTAIQQKDFEKTNSSGGAWVVEEGKTVRRALIGERFARMKARPRREMRTELDQSHFLIGAAFEASGLNIDEEFKKSSFLIRPGVEALLDWYAKAPAGAWGGDEPGVPRAAALALTLFRKAKEARIIKMRQEDPMLFEEWEAAAV